jgi:hypothetical protein
MLALVSIDEITDFLEGLHGALRGISCGSQLLGS